MSITPLSLIEKLIDERGFVQRNIREAVRKFITGLDGEESELVVEALAQIIFRNITGSDVARRNFCRYIQ